MGAQIHPVFDKVIYWIAYSDTIAVFVGVLLAGVFFSALAVVRGIRRLLSRRPS